MPNKKLIRFDWAMKYILRNKANFDVLEGFISNLIKEEIKVESIIESESNKDAENRKVNRVDLMCKDSQCRQVIIEIQIEREVDYLHRLLLENSKTIVESIDIGNNSSDVSKVIAISILYRNMRIREKENTDFIYYGTSEMVGIYTKKPLALNGVEGMNTDKQVVTCKNVLPEYFMIYVENFEDIVNEDIDEWVYFFKHGAIRDDFKSL